MFKKKISHEEIRTKAYKLWMAREGRGKTSLDDWNEAEEALKIERSLFKQICEWTGFKKKTAWDILQLFIVPAFLSGGAIYLQYAAKHREEKAADDKAKQETLTKYFDQMADLLLNEKLLQTLSKPDSEIFIIGRSKTVTVLQSLDPARQHLVIQFLKSANLNGADSLLRKGLLYQAQMSNTNLPGANLSEANLSEANLNGANLSGADLSGADLSGADLLNAKLDGAKLGGAKLGGANLIHANLIHSILGGADLSGADLSGADLSTANLINANLSNSYLINANLSNAKLHNAMFINADLGGSDLSGADLRDAKLHDAKLINADLSGADLSNAKLDIKQIEAACYWQDAKFSDNFRKQLDMSISQKVDPNCRTLWYHY